MTTQQYISYLRANVTSHMGDFTWYANHAIQLIGTSKDVYLHEGPLYCTCGCNSAIDRLSQSPDFLNYHLEKQDRLREEVHLKSNSYFEDVEFLAKWTLFLVQRDGDPKYSYNSVAWYLALNIFDYCMVKTTLQEKFVQIFLDTWEYYYTQF